MFGFKKKSIAYGILLIVTLVPLFGLGLSNHGVWTPDEPRVAEIGREMALTGNWAVPTLNGKPFLEKPPLYFWALAGTFTAFGEASDRIARIPSALFGFAGTVMIFFLARMLFGPRVGFLSAFILATSIEYFRAAHWLVVDNALVFSIVAAMTFFMAGYLSDTGRRRLVFYVLFYVFCGLAFLSKGFIGLAFPGLGVLVFLVWERNLKEFWAMRLWLGAAILVVLSVPWLLALWHQGGREYIDVFLIKNNLERFLPGGMSGHHRPFYHYLGQFPGSFLPWSLFIVPVFWQLVARKREGLSPRSKRGILFLSCWFVSGFLLLSFAATKRGIYLLPILAPAAVLTAYWIERTLGEDPPGKVDRLFLLGFALLTLGAGLVLGAVNLYLTRNLAVFFLAHTILIIALSVWALTLLREKRMEKFWIAAHGALFGVLVFMLLWLIPSINQYKSFVPFTRQVKEIVGPDDVLYGYKPDETLRGVVPFYTGRYVEEIYDPGVLKDVFGRKDQIFMAIMDKRGRREKDIRSTGKAYLVLRRKVGNRRICSLFTNRKNVQVMGGS